MKKMKWVLGHPIITFLLGMIVALSSVAVLADNPTPSLSSENIQTPLEGTEGLSPSSYLTEDDIRIFHDKVEIDMHDARWATFKPTGSMKPVLDHTSHALQVEPTCSKIEQGDIISYESDLVDERIIHRVIAIGNDDKGSYYITKGDNNPEKDPEKVRCHQIKRKTVAILY